MEPQGSRRNTTGSLGEREMETIFCVARIGENGNTEYLCVDISNLEFWWTDKKKLARPILEKKIAEITVSSYRILDSSHKYEVQVL